MAVLENLLEKGNQILEASYPAESLVRAEELVKLLNHTELTEASFGTVGDLEGIEVSVLRPTGHGLPNELKGKISDIGYADDEHMRKYALDKSAGSSGDIRVVFEDGYLVSSPGAKQWSPPSGSGLWRGLQDNVYDIPADSLAVLWDSSMDQGRAELLVEDSRYEGRRPHFEELKGPNARDFKDSD